MHELLEIEMILKKEAVRLSGDEELGLNGAPVVIIVGGTRQSGVSGTLVASSFKNAQMRDMLGVLQAAIQIVSLKHFFLDHKRLGPALLKRLAASSSEDAD